MGGRILRASRQDEKADYLESRDTEIVETNMGDFPGGPVVKNPPSNAGDAGSIPGWGTEIPHTTGQLSPRATTTEPAHSGTHEPH